MNTEILQIVAARIDERCKLIEGDLAMGKAVDFGDYKFACGRYRGMLTVKDILIELSQEMEEDDGE